MSALIGELVEHVPIVNKETTNHEVNERFKRENKCFGIVIVENDLPIGLVTRTNFYQKLGSLYGYNLYINKTIELLMNKNILVVDYATSIIEVSQSAMKRTEEELYDYVIVTRYGQYYGVVSISLLLLTFAEIQTEIASYLNPLTGLPGNHIIEQQLNEVSNYDHFAVLYLDLDHFKVYNDLFGFAKGDQVIQATANLLQQVIKKENGFLGHIGGDDFLAILPHSHYELCCAAIISEFDELIKDFYPEEYISKQYVIGVDRFGVQRKFSLLSISIAVVTNEIKTFSSADEIVSYATQLKKVCKERDGSCYVDSVYS